METTQFGTDHFHLMLQFREPQDRNLSKFVFEGHKPNGRQKDILGEGICGKRLQFSINKGMFYCLADKAYGRPPFPSQT